MINIIYFPVVLSESVFVYELLLSFFVNNIYCSSVKYPATVISSYQCFNNQISVVEEELRSYK